MNKIALAALLLGLSLAGCSKDAAGPDEPDIPATEATDEDREPALELDDTALGEIIVDGNGRAVYTYAGDVQGAAASTCKAACLEAWPPVPAEAKPDVDDLSGDAGFAKDATGKRQLTYNGWPLYHYSGDKAPGDTNGQGLKDQWWVLNAAGEKVQTRP